MKNIDRRKFLKQAAAGLGVLTASINTADGREQMSTDKELSASDQVVLGKTGIEVSRLALGSGTAGWGKRSNQTRLGMKKFVSLIQHGYERGINFWDSADQYGSHPHFKEALKHIPREKVVILTKSNSDNAANMKFVKVFFGYFLFQKKVTFIFIIKTTNSKNIKKMPLNNKNKKI